MKKQGVPQVRWWYLSLRCGGRGVQSVHGLVQHLHHLLVLLLEPGTQLFQKPVAHKHMGGTVHCFKQKCVSLFQCLALACTMVFFMCFFNLFFPTCFFFYTIHETQVCCTRTSIEPYKTHIYALWITTSYFHHYHTLPTFKYQLKTHFFSKHLVE